MKTHVLFALLAAVLLSVSAVTEAQGPQPMTIVASLSTSGCGTGDCNTTDCYPYCASGTFTAPSTGTYYLCVKLSCSAGSCEHCQACVNVNSRSDPSFHENAHTPTSQTATCGQVVPVALTAGETYSWCLCIHPVGIDNCMFCTCTADAYVSTSSTCD